jgi:hypothetical protein
VIDAGHQAGKRLRDYAFFDDPVDPRSALLVECGQHWERGAPEVARARDAALPASFGMLQARRRPRRSRGRAACRRSAPSKSPT